METDLFDHVQNKNMMIATFSASKPLANFDLEGFTTDMILSVSENRSAYQTACKKVAEIYEQQGVDCVMLDPSQAKMLMILCEPNGLKIFEEKLVRIFLKPSSILN